MDLWYIFITAFIVGLSGAMMPGPLLTVTITESARRGFIAGPLLILGHALLEGALLIALVLGLGTILTQPATGKIIAVVGGVFLTWMGVQMARDAHRGNIELKDISTVDTGGQGEDTGKKGSDKWLFSGSMHPVPAGILVSLSNPYWTLWWATIGLGYITMSLKQGSAGVLSFFAGHISADLGWYSLVAAGVISGRRFLGANVYRAIIVVCGIFLVFLGLSFIYYGLKVHMGTVLLC
jgi:threonine/homoserine/homoserine lactone efflux protein